jgi:hypothetical protein
MEFPAGPSKDVDAEDALAWLMRFLDANPNDDALCSGALTIGEPIIDWHWERIGDDLVRLAEESAAFRKMLSCCDLDAATPDAFQARLYSLVRPEDNIGGGQAFSDPH